jgi:hypothetical protein
MLMLDRRMLLRAGYAAIGAATLAPTAGSTNSRKRPAVCSATLPPRATRHLLHEKEVENCMS